MEKSKLELTRKQKLGRRFLPMVALTLAASGYAGVKIHEEGEYHPIGTERVMLGEGGTPTGAVSEIVDDIAKKHNFDPGTVAGVTEASQKIIQEERASTGHDTIQPNQQVEATVSENGFGHYKVDANLVNEGK